MCSPFWRDCKLGLCTPAGDCWTTSTPTSRTLATRAPTMPAKTVHNPNACIIGVNGDHRLVLGLRCNDFGVDIFELGVAVRMLRAFIGLAIELAREPELHQLGAYRIGTDRMPHLGQRGRQLLHAFRHPDQGT